MSTTFAHMNPDMKHVFAFLRQHRQCWIDKKTKVATNVPLTHTFLDGTHTGKLCVPASLMQEFYAAVARDVKAGQMPPLNELKTEVFNFFVDFDLNISKDCTDDLSARTVAAATTKQVARFLPGERDDWRCIVTTSPDKESKKDESFFKRGIHLYFPNVHVTTHEALTMREAIIVALKRDVSSTIDWTEDFDNAPYANSAGGLRMLGAPKVQTCAACRNVATRKSSCAECMGQGTFVYSQHAYTFDVCLGRDGAIDEARTELLQRNADALVRVASVRTTASAISPDWKCFDACPSYSALKKRARGPSEAGNKSRRFPEESKSMRAWPKVPVTDARKLECIQSIFRTRFHPVYANVTISQINYSSKNSTYYAQFSGEGENFCLNINGRHKSNRVYGVVGLTHAYIRCHCNCNTLQGRIQNKLCRDFESERKRLTGQQIAKLHEDDGTGNTGKMALHKGAFATMTSNNEYLTNMSQFLHDVNNMR